MSLPIDHAVKLMVQAKRDQGDIEEFVKWEER
jgi:hypothetical protein